MSPPRAALVLAALLGACAERHVPEAALPEQAATLGTRAAAVPSAEPLVVEASTPRNAAWVVSNLAPATPTLAIRITNRGATVADVSDVRVYLEAIREGISFRCAASVGPPAGSREPTRLAPGATLELERSLDCSLPLAGAYVVQVAVSFGKDGWRTPRPVRAFTLTVRAPETIEPRPIAAVPGLWAGIGSSQVLVGTSGGGSGRMALSLVNGGAAKLELPPTRLELRVYRKGTPIPCEGEPIAIDLPGPLASGEARRLPFEVSCLGLTVPGSYTVVATLKVGTTAAVEIGRLRIDISTDPARQMPPLIRVLP